jgi:hypothetical protein
MVYYLCNLHLPYDLARLSAKHVKHAKAARSASIIQAKHEATSFGWNRFVNLRAVVADTTQTYKQTETYTHPTPSGEGCNENTPGGGRPVAAENHGFDGRPVAQDLLQAFTAKARGLQVMLRHLQV